MEIIFSKAIIRFKDKLRNFSRGILENEMKMKTTSSRFYLENHTYPLLFAIFEHPSKLGYFDSALYEIGVNKYFITEKDEEVQNLLRHELAHYITFIKHGQNVASHGKEFQAVCKEYSFPSLISKAKINIKQALKNKHIYEKVRKLLSLSLSSNDNESLAAANKAKELLLKYNLKTSDYEEQTIIVRILKKQRGGKKLQAIADILRTLYVYPVLNYGLGCVYLEIMGDKVNVKIADYVAHYLDKHFEKLWKEQQHHHHNLKGLGAKNAFFAGISKGFTNRLYQKKSSALVKVESQLIEKVALHYPHLKKSLPLSKEFPDAHKVGKIIGKQLKLQSGIDKSNSQKSLTFQK